MYQAAFAGVENQINRVYTRGRRAELERQAPFHPEVLTSGNLAAHREQIGEIKYLFSTWGMPALSPEELELLPSLEAVFYAAGSVQGFARPLLQQGVKVFSAWAANAVPVAEFTVAQILLANKGYFANTAHFTAPDKIRNAPRGRGNFGAVVSLLGAGQIGRHVIRLLAPFELVVQVFDPFLSEEAAAQLGVRKVELDEAFATAQVVSNHLANLPATVGMLKGHHFASMPPHSVFINTGRGATVEESALLQVLLERPDIFALLDVTHPEPPVVGSPLYSLPNVRLSTHIAGSIGDEVVRMADYMIEEFGRLRRGEETRYLVTEAMLETMA